MKRSYILPWPKHVQCIFTAIGQVMRCERLYPEDLERLPSGFGAILPDHTVKVIHFSAKQIGYRRGYYEIFVSGSIYRGGWRFSSGELEALVKSTLNGNGGL